MVSEIWKHLSLGEVITLQRGYDLPHKDRKPGNVHVVSSSGSIATHSESRVAGPGVVTGRYGTIGEVFFVSEDFWPLNTTLFVKDFKGNDPLFISYLLRTIDYHTYSGKSGVPGVNRNDLYEIGVTLPPPPEQRIIASALSDVDATISTLDQLIAKKRDIKQGAMQELLTGTRRLPGFSGKWEMKKITNLLVQPATYGIVKAGNFQAFGIPMIRGGDIKNGRINPDLPLVTNKKSEEYSRTILKKDDVVIALVGYPGESAKIPVSLEGANMSRAVGLLRPSKQILSDFLVCYLNSPIGRKKFLIPSAGSAQLVVNLKDLNVLEIPVPKTDKNEDFNEQLAIATVISDMDSEIDVLEQKRDKTRALKQGMMQELLTGKMRLV